MLAVKIQKGILEAKKAVVLVLVFVFTVALALALVLVMYLLYHSKFSQISRP